MSLADLTTGCVIVLAGYLLGAVPVGLLVARWRRGIDIRQYGSGNTGATNVLRTLGWKASLVVFVADLVKTIVPVYIAQVLTGSAWVEALAGVAAIAGHCWPVYARWSGGRGSTSSLAGLLVIQPIVALACLTVAVVTVLFTRFVSLGSLCAMAFGGIVMTYLVARGAAPIGDVVYIVGSLLIVFVRHRDNISRLLAGTERKLGQKSEMLGSNTAT